MNTERLLKLADFLDTVPAEQFDLSSWKCSTTACAVGWACTIPEFQDEGLRSANMAHAGLPLFDNKSGWDAVNAFFAVTDEQADHLFYDLNYPNRHRTTPAEVANRIRKLVIDSSK
jgi:hypothetical protein